ncbi:MAG: exodeoxyribonuclease III [Planctomycetota bacterium]
MKITTWNVNSLRIRPLRLRHFLETEEPDVLCLQETKAEDHAFPREIFDELGYRLEVFGQKTYNGVAIASKQPIEDVQRGFPDDDADGQKRLIAATVGGVRIIDVYVPNGSSVDSPKFPFKLDWLAQLRQWIADHHEPSQPLLLCGDFNIAPDDRDVWDPEKWRGKVLFHPKEHAALKEIRDWGLQDAFRIHHEEGGVYSWWDYRGGAFRFNHGLRIDLILVTRPLAERCTEVTIHRDTRKVLDGEKPSDHAAVSAVFSD